MYYGNSSATDGQAATSVWNSNYVGVWHLKESSGTTVADSTTKSNTGTKVSSTEPNPTTSGQIDGAQTFDGSNDFIDAGTPSNLGWSGDQAFTIEAWIKPTSTRNDGAFFSYGNAGGNQVISLVAGGSDTIYSVHYGNDHPFTTTYTLGSWQQVVITYNPIDGSGTEKLYKNGAYTNESWTPTNLSIISGHKLYIGRASWNSTFVNTTDIDEIKISDTVRSAAWIAASYKSEVNTFNTFASEEQQYPSSGTLTSSIFDSEFTGGAAWGTLTFAATTPTSTTATVKVRTSSSSSMTGATDFGSCTAISSGSDISSNSCVTDSHRYAQYLITLGTSAPASTPTFTSYSLTFAAYDADAPSISLTALTPDPNSDTTPTLSGTATDSIGTVSNVQFQIDSTSGSWSSCSVDDGSFDEASETFTCTPSALSDGSHTMYVRATDSNSNTTSNASASTDTFTIDVTSPASFDLDSPGDNSYTNSERPTFKWKATTDATSGLSSYSLVVDNGDSGDFTISGIPTSRTTDYETNKYLVHYEGGYISIYTKSHNDWTSGENYGKLKEGSRSWKIKAIDAAGNERSEGRTLIVDFTSPALSSLSSSSLAGAKGGYLLITSRKPNLTGAITDNFSPDKVEVSIYKESYFLGAITSKELFTSLTYSLSNSSNNKSLTFSIPVPQSLDFGSYEVSLKGSDKAGNTSAASFIYLKVVTARQAQELLQGKVDKETIQEKQQVSLPELEKKAVLRREKEAAEFEKAVQSFGDFFSYLARGAQNAASAIASRLAVIPNLIGNLYESISSGLAMTGNATGQSFVAMTSGIGSGYNNLARKAPGAVKNLMLAFEKGVNTLSSTISSTNQVTLNALNKSQTNLQDKARKSSKETANLISSAAISTADFLASINRGLTNSQKEAGKQIAQTHKNTSDFMKDKSQRISKGITLAFRSFQNPVQDSTDLLDRTKIWLLTFGSIVIDPEPTAISDVTIEKLGKDYAVVSWKTNHYAWGKVNWGKDLTYGQEVILTKREKVHTARLTGLKPGEKYYFEVMSQNKNYAYDAYYSFETIR